MLAFNPGEDRESQLLPCKPSLLGFNLCSDLTKTQSGFVFICFFAQFPSVDVKNEIWKLRLFLWWHKTN